MQLFRWFNKKFSVSLRMGQGMVEFAIAIPVFLLLVWGLIEAGRLLFIYSSVITASREAARYAAASEHLEVSDCDAIKARAADIGSFAGIINANVNVKYIITDDNNVYGCPPITPFPAWLTAGDQVSVDVWAFYKPIVPIDAFRVGNSDGYKIESTSTFTIIKDISAKR